MEFPDALRLETLRSLLRGPRLQVANLFVFYVVVYLTLDFPNPVEKVGTSIALAIALDAVAGKLRYGGWRVPWGAIIGTGAAWLVLDGHGWIPYLTLPPIVVAAKRLLRFRGEQLFNANNVAMVALLIVGTVRVGVNDWGAAPQTLALMVLFGTVSSSRVHRLDIALIYLGLSLGVYFGTATMLGWGLPTAWIWALSPLQVMIGFFGVTDPASSPSGRRLEKAVWALLVVLIAVPPTVAGYAEAPIFALFAAAPQRLLVREGLDRLRGALQDAREGPPKTPEAAGGGP